MLINKFNSKFDREITFIFSDFLLKKNDSICSNLIFGFLLRSYSFNKYLTKNNIVCLRPKIGICSSKYFNVLNKKTNKKIEKNSPIFLNYLN